MKKVKMDLKLNLRKEKISKLDLQHSKGGYLPSWHSCIATACMDCSVGCPSKPPIADTP